MSSRGVNKVIIVGRLGQDPEVRYAPSGAAFANLSVATSEQWRDKQTGEQKELTEWHRVVLSGKLAEVAGEYLRKGVGGTMQMIGGRQDGGGGQQQSSGWGKPQMPQNGNPSRQQPAQQPKPNDPPIDFDDDIPF